MPMDTPDTTPDCELPLLIAAPMLDFACNQKGCCCKGWGIHFRPSGLARLAEALPEKERNERLAWGIKIIVDDEDTDVIKFIKLDRLEPDDRCRFLEPTGGCEIHRRFSAPALPDLCVQFPTVAYQTPQGVEFHYETVCPSVLDQLAHSTTPYLPVQLSPNQHPAIADRGRIIHPVPPLALGDTPLHWEALTIMRNTTLTALTDTDTPAIQHLAAILYGFDKLLSNPADPTTFALDYDAPLEPFFDYLEQCAWANNVRVILHLWGNYKRFIWDFDRDDPRLEALESHLFDWHPPLRDYMIPQ